MTVQELFFNTDMDDIIDAYMFKHGICTTTLEASTHTLQENINAVRTERELVKNLILNIIKAKADEKDAEKILFCIPYYSADYDDKNKIEYSTFFVHKEEAIQKINLPDWANDDDMMVMHYAYDFSPLHEVVGMTIAECCLSGNLAVPVLEITTDILENLSFFGYEEEPRLQRLDEIFSELDESMKHYQEAVEQGKPAGTPAKVVFEQMRQDILNSCETEDERNHYIYTCEYHDKVHEIEYRYTETIIRQNNLLTEQYYKAEFLR